MNVHVPVLKNEILSILSGHLNVLSQAHFVDCTFGGGGHTEAILEKYNNVKVLGCDQDSTAIEVGKKKLKQFVDEKRLEFFHGSFCDLPEKYSGFLLDLGYSSNQLQ